jgi:predicted DNA-binding transcriptional regulator AlpA
MPDIRQVQKEVEKFLKDRKLSFEQTPLNIKAVAKLLSLSKSSIVDYIDDGTLKALKVSAAKNAGWRISVRAIHDYLIRNRMIVKIPKKQ